MTDTVDGAARQQRAVVTARRVSTWAIASVAAVFWIFVTVHAVLQFNGRGLFWTVSLISVNSLLCGLALYVFWRELHAPVRAAEAHALSLTQEFIRAHVPGSAVVRQPFKAVDNTNMVGFTREQFCKFCESDIENYDAIVFLCSRPLLRMNNGFCQALFRIMDRSKVVIYAFLSDDGMQDFLDWDADVQKEHSGKYVDSIAAVSIEHMGAHYPPVNVGYLLRTRDGFPVVHVAYQASADPTIDASFFYSEIPDYKHAVTDRSVHQILGAVIRALHVEAPTYRARVQRVLAAAGIAENSIRDRLTVV